MEFELEGGGVILLFFTVAGIVLGSVAIICECCEKIAEIKYKKEKKISEETK